MKTHPETALIEAWAKLQKRVTNGAIRRAFDLNEDAADVVYNHLKSAGIVGSMGYVQEAK